MKKVCILGCGRLGRIVASEIAGGSVPGCVLAGVADANEAAAAAAAACSCVACDSLEELMALQPDYVVEATTPQVLRECASRILTSGIDLIVLSVGAFSDSAFRAEMAATAREHHAHVYLASGVLGGFDFIQAAALYGGVRGTLTYKKHGAGSPKCPPGFEELPDSYTGNLMEAFQAYPKHLNIAISFGLATGDFVNNTLVLQNIGEDEYTGFQIDLEGDFGRAQMYFQQGSPQKSVYGPMLAAYSAVSRLRSLTEPISF